MGVVHLHVFSEHLPMAQGGEVPLWSQYCMGRVWSNFACIPILKTVFIKKSSSCNQHGKKDKFHEQPAGTVPQHGGIGEKRPFHLQSPTRDLITYPCTKKPTISRMWAISCMHCWFNSSDKLFSESISGSSRNSTGMSWASFVCSSHPGEIHPSCGGLGRGAAVEVGL